MKELHTRTIWGILFVAVLAGSIILGAFTFGVLFVTISAYVLHEFYSLCREAGYSPQIYPGLILGQLIFLLSFLIARHTISYEPYSYLLLLMYMIPVYEIFRKKDHPLANIALTIFGNIYITIPFSLLNFLVFSQKDGITTYNYQILISLFVFVWASDSGAYIFGVRFGHRRLMERISPKKSWEGLIGGAFTSVIAAWLLTKIFPQYHFLFMASSALVVVVAGTLGDLVESMIKRSIGVKDSGKFLPGHGGLLDRFDSILLASPIIYFIFHFFL